PRGHLVDEAEDAAVGAGMLFVPQVGGKIASKVLAGLAGHLQLPDGALYAGGQVKAGAVGVKLVVQRVVDGVAVHRHQLVPRAQAQRLGVAARGHCVDLDGHRPSPFSSQNRAGTAAPRSESKEEGEGITRPPLLSYIHYATK